MTSSGSAATILGGQRYVSLTTYRRDGSPVATPVWAAPRGDALYVWTARSSGKVKRIRRSGAIAVTPCDMRGRLRGEPTPAHAEILPDDQTKLVLDLIGAKYGLLGRGYIWLSQRRGTPGSSVGLKITF